MRFAIILCSLVFASAAFVTPSVEAQVPGQSSLSGAVCLQAPWGECAERLPDASVRIVGGGVLGVLATDKTVQSDADGQYLIDQLPDGDYDLTVSHPGFTTVETTVTVSGATQQDVTLAGEQVDVAGRVEDAKGTPLAGARINMWGSYGWADAKTDADGRFSVSLPAGWYELSVETQDHRLLQQRILVDGSDVLLTFEALAGQEALLRGRVLDQHGAAVADAYVIVSQWEARRSDGSSTYGNFRNSTLTGGDGRYAIDVYGGDVSIEVRKAGHAHANQWLYIEATESRTIDFELVKYPAKTAQLAGTVTDAQGNELPFIRVSIELPEYGLHECSNATYGHGGHAVAIDIASSEAPYPYQYQPEPCAIGVEGGSFAGNVTPGYAIVHVWYDRWAACDETYHSDGSYERNCGPDYFPYTQTTTLLPDAENVLDIVMQQRPGPDAAISGYALSAETGKAIAGAWVSFSHQDSYGWGSAKTDADGSYKVRLRSGYQQVEVWADGHLPWQGVINIASGGETPLDVVLTPGEARYGGCCYDRGYAEMSVSADSATGAQPAPSGAGPAGGGDGAEYEDMGGGLGPYDAEARAKLLQPDTKDAKSVPSPLAWATIAVAAALVVRRRR